MTKKEVLTKVVNGDALNAEELEVIQKMIEGLEKKSSKVNKTTIENIGVKNDILALIADGHARTAKQIADELGLSTNKVAALLKACVADGKAEKLPGAKAKDAPVYVGREDAEPYAEPQGEDK